MKFIKKCHVYDKDVIQPKELILNKSLVQDAMFEYRDFVDSNKWYTASGQYK